LLEKQKRKSFDLITKSKDRNYISSDGTTKLLPKTGEKKQTVLILLLGLSIMVATIYGFVISKKRKKL
jgi:LPXTG-motif cell wall-anchored protein